MSDWLLHQMTVSVMMMVMMMMTFCYKGLYWDVTAYRKEPVDWIVALYQGYFPDFDHCTEFCKRTP